MGSIDRYYYKRCVNYFTHFITRLFEDIFTID